MANSKILKRGWKLTLIALATLAFLLVACRSPFPPVAGSGHVYFEEAPEVRVSVRDCPGPVFTVALRQAIEAAEPEGDLVLIFHRGRSHYLGRSGGRGYGLVRCGEWEAVAGIIREHNWGLSRP